MTTSSYNFQGVQKKILAIVLAGGEGARLRPLTMTHAKPALPFGGSFRLIDFVLSNLVNSGIASIYLLAQYKPESLIDHVNANWQFASEERGRFVKVVLPRHEHGGYFRGTADAVHQNLALIEDHAPDLVAVFAADHVYRMDVRQMVHYHLERDADVTIAATQVPIEHASSFGIIAAGHNGEVLDFQEKPDAPIAVPFNPSRAYASMGNYLFNTEVLVEELARADRLGETDFGGHVFPRLIHNHHVHAYDFSGNVVPGVQPHEESAYWRDVGTLEAYVNAHQDIVGREPLFNLQNPFWPILPASTPQPRALSQKHHAHHEWGMRNSLPQAIGNTLLAQWDAMPVGHA